MILKPLQILYEGLSNLKNTLYDYNILKKIQMPIPVLSIGNLSVGGTGKTPCVCFIVEAILKKKMFAAIGIVSRSYKASLKSAERVDLDRPGASLIYGDEPCLLQQKLPQCQVWSGPKKYQTAQAASKEKLDLIIVDDGFSHRKLSRQFDLVLLDATAPLSDYQTLPTGRLRESLSQLHRAQALVITKANLVQAEKIDQLLQLMLGQKGVFKKNIYLAHLHSDIGDLDPNVHSLFIFCGLGQPSSFITSLTHLGFTIAKENLFADHHNYSVEQLNGIQNSYLAEKIKNPNLRLVTTAKDAIKFLNHPIQKYMNVVDYHFTILDNKEGSLLEKISHCL